VSELLDHIEKADKDDILLMAGKQGLKMDIPEIPELLFDNTDRNSTSSSSSSTTASGHCRSIDYKAFWHSIGGPTLRQHGAFVLMVKREKKVLNNLADLWSIALNA
jgi:hypothetical protein